MIRGPMNGQKQRRSRGSRWFGVLTWVFAISIIIAGVLIMQRSMKLSTIESAVEKIGLFKALALDTISKFRRNYNLS